MPLLRAIDGYVAEANGIIGLLLEIGGQESVDQWIIDDPTMQFRKCRKTMKSCEVKGVGGTPRLPHNSSVVRNYASKFSNFIAAEY